MESAVDQQAQQESGERNAPEQQPQSFIRIARVKEISGFSKSTALRWIKAGKFPAPVIREGNNCLWDLGEVMAWRKEQFRLRDEREAVEKIQEAGA